MTTAGIYLRISRDSTHKRQGVTRQREDCEGLARERGWTVADRFEDNDLSAWNGNPRPEYQRMLTAIEAGAIDAVIAWKSDRLHRDPDEASAFFKLCLAHGVAIALVDGDLDLSSAHGKLSARTQADHDAYASDVASERISRSELSQAEAGNPHGGGARPYGFADNRIDHDPIEAGVIRRAAAHVLAGKSLRAFVRQLNRDGVNTSKGNPWQASVLAAMLLRPRLAGLREHHGVVIGPAAWEPIIPEADHYALRALLTSRRRAQVSRGKSLLTGILYCGSCGHKLHVKSPSKGHTRRYRCDGAPRGCAGVSIVADPLDAFIRAQVDAIGVGVREPSPAAPALIDVAPMRAAKLALADLFADDLDADAYTRGVRAVDAKIAAAEAANVAAAAGGHRWVARDPLTTFDGETQREAVRAEIERITVSKSPKHTMRFDPARVAIEWWGNDPNLGVA
jgi:DNA invertase Pin-like site-specific DNA recombinase